MRQKLTEREREKGKKKKNNPNRITRDHKPLHHRIIDWDVALGKPFDKCLNILSVLLPSSHLPQITPLTGSRLGRLETMNDDTVPH